MRTLTVFALSLACLLPANAVDFNAVSAWVTGVKFARSASRDRRTSLPVPCARASFRLKNGGTESLFLADVDWKGRHYVERLLDEAEREKLDGAVFLGVTVEGVTPEDEGIRVDEARIFKVVSKPLTAPRLPRRNLKPLRGQDTGCNTGPGILPFPTSENTILPRGAAAKPALSVVPAFAGGPRLASERTFLETVERREGRTLTVDLFAPPGKVTEIVFGLPREAPVVRTLRMPFLPYGDLHLLEGGLFRYAAVDWCRSNASLVTTNETDGTVLIRYLPKTDGTYNPVCERIVIALSDRLEDVLPEIPNPPSPYRGVTGVRTWRTHASSDRSRDKALWRRLHDLGVTEVCVLDHETMWRDGGEPFTFVTEAARGKGGDAGLHDYADFMVRELGYVYGPYNNYTDLASASSWWDRDRVILSPSGTLQRAWVRCYGPKPALVPDISDRVTRELQEKFGFCGAYCDVHTATPPWRRTDYDARLPGAATFTQAFYAYGDLMLRQRTNFRGPVWSEGGMQFMYAGLTDGNYGRDMGYDFRTMPWIVDFDLLRIHPLECDFGMGALGHFSPERDESRKAFYLPAMPDGREALVDGFIAATLAFGHAGYLILDWCWEPAKMFGPAYCGPSRETFEEGLPIALRSYFMTQAPAARYTQSMAESIRYLDADGRALTTSEAIVSGVVARNQVSVRYADGTQVVANGNRTERLRARIDGEPLDLPPLGYRVWTMDGTLFVESGDACGTRARFDYAESPGYVYIDGRGKPVGFRKGRTDGEPHVTCPKHMGQDGRIRPKTML